MSSRTLIGCALLSIIFTAGSAGQGETMRQWPGFRGPYATCILDHANTAVEWDVETGEEIWRTPREEVSTWSTPAVYEKNGSTKITVNGFGHMGGYDFETGREIWKMSGGSDAPFPAPVIAHDLIYLNNAHGRYSPIHVVRPEAKGDITLE